MLSRNTMAIFLALMFTLISTAQCSTLRDLLNSYEQSDPVSTACKQMCREEDRRMMACAKRHRCATYLDLSKFEIAAYESCMKPCLKITSKCYSLCAENYNFLVAKCMNIKGSYSDKMDCILDTFSDINTPQPQSTTVDARPTLSALPIKTTPKIIPLLRLLKAKEFLSTETPETFVIQ
ncbi:hypothetical protein ElyMa_005155900 [Elysia marginata]|uniref:Chondroitin proteoglycan 4 domain-containing protein n=1 Tax=Elysia marginata TaxID=1093978 RepID=A0AAV4JUZ9_9GAST|nr:hypothetical protein ElyMa_005155900 [Elysia marginata]